MVSWITNARTLWLLGFAYLFLTIGFGIVILIFDLHIIDEVSNPDRVRAIVASFSPNQRRAHFWMTLILDMPYPLVYGGFYAGLAHRVFGKWGPLLAIPALVTIPADLIENTTQLFILAGHEHLAWIKQYVTPVKLAGFISASVIALIALALLIRRRVAGRKISDPGRT